MCGSRNGVATQIASEEPRAVFIHCYGHALNLAAEDTVKKNITLLINFKHMHAASAELYVIHKCWLPA